MPLFRVSGTPAQVESVRAAVAGCTFPFDALAPGLRALTGRDAVEVSFARLAPGVGGLSYSDGRIEISEALDAASAGPTFLMEAAHSVDFFLMTSAQRQAVYALFHPGGHDGHGWFDGSGYWEQVGEGWMYLFVWAFTDLRPASPFAHKPTEASAAAVRDLFGVSAPQPQPQPPVVPPVHPPVTPPVTPPPPPVPPVPPVPPPVVPPVVPPPVPPVVVPPGLTLEQAINAAQGGIADSGSYLFGAKGRAMRAAAAGLTRYWPKP